MLRPRVAISLGDPNGIGPEVALGAFCDVRMLRFVEPVFVGSAQVLHRHAETLAVPAPALEFVGAPEQSTRPDACAVFDVDVGVNVEVEFGRITPKAGRIAMMALETATDIVAAGHADALVTAPISKEAVSRAGYRIPGHTEFLARRLDSDPVLMLLVADRLRVGLVTGHIPLSDVAPRITRKTLLKRIRTAVRCLERDYGVERPTIAVLGLNPHAGDGGILGKHEIEVIVPALEQCRREGMFVFGPYAADGFFGTAAYRKFDMVLAMYHDQGLVAFKSLAFGRGVNHTAGLPIVRTSPDHGTAFGIAGHGKASPDSMRSALLLARDIIKHRAGSRL